MDIYTPKTAAEVLGISEDHVRHLRQQGRFPHAFQPGERGWLIPAKDVRAEKRRREKAAKAKSKKS